MISDVRDTPPRLCCRRANTRIGGRVVIVVFGMPRKILGARYRMGELGVASGLGGLRGNEWTRLE